MQGTIESIEERLTKAKKPYHGIKIDGVFYFVWDAKLMEGISEGLVEYESDGDEYPKITSISMCTGATPPPKQTSKYDDTKVWNTSLMCAKDIMVALINSTTEGKELTATEIRETVVRMGLAFYKASENGVAFDEKAPNETPPEPEKEEPESDQTLYDSFNYQLINKKWANKEELAQWWADCQGSMLKMTEEERGKLIKTYSSELGKTK